MMQRHLLIFTFLVSFVLNAYSAIELRSTQMRTSDGLPNNSIRYIYQDSKGFLWLATRIFPEVSASLYKVVPVISPLRGLNV